MVEQRSRGLQDGLDGLAAGVEPVQASGADTPGVPLDAAGELPSMRVIDAYDVDRYVNLAKAALGVSLALYLVIAAAVLWLLLVGNPE